MDRVSAGAELCADALGEVMVVAPHPDDEAIGCGGLMALLSRRGVAVSVLLISDGDMSHPGSKRWSRTARAAMRRAEFDRSLAVLGVDSSVALGCPDGAVPGPGDPAFAGLVARVEQQLRAHPHRTLIVPWRRDPHADHRAASSIARTANRSLTQPARVLEYMVWAPERGRPDEQPQGGEVRTWRLDISGVVAVKLQAVAAHRSQCGGVIDDDPAGFTLPASMLERCALPWETYYEAAAEFCEQG